MIKIRLNTGIVKNERKEIIKYDRRKYLFFSLLAEVRLSVNDKIGIKRSKMIKASCSL